jgi:hypothetical protein
MHPAESGRGGENNDAIFIDAIDGVLKAIEADEAAILWDIDLPLEFATQRTKAALELVLEDVGHGHEFDRRAADGKCIGGSAGATTAATDERDFGGVIFGSVDEGDLDAGQCGSGGGGFEETATRGTSREGIIHNVADGAWSTEVLSMPEAQERDHVLEAVGYLPHEDKERARHAIGSA